MTQQAETVEWALTPCTAFSGSQRIAAGELRHVAPEAKRALDQDSKASILIFNNITSQVIEVDFRGSVDDVAQRITDTMTPITEPTPQGPGRPKLGVIAREVTLLPRHWDWLNQQPGGASVALRKLVEEAKRASAGKDRARQSQEATYRFISVMAGDRPGFEEATRALFAGNKERFDQMMKAWPVDIREHASQLSEAAFLGNME